MPKCNRSHLFCALLTLILVASATAQNPAAISFNTQTKVFRIDAANQTYAFGINDKNALQPVYWGQRLGATDPLAAPHTNDGVASFDSSPTTTPNEYSAWGGGLFVEPALKVSFPDGNRDLVLKYVSHSIRDNELTITMKDSERDLAVDLRYSVDPATGIVGRSAVIVNHTKSVLTIDQAAAATWNLPRGTDYSLRYLTGRWAGEPVHGADCRAQGHDAGIFRHHHH